MSDPERLFEDPVSKIATQLGGADVLIQLVPTDNEGPWLEAERLFAQELGVPTLRIRSAPLSDNDFAAIRSALRRRRHALQPIARFLHTHGGYVGDDEVPMPLLRSHLCLLAVLAAAAFALGIFSKSATVFAIASASVPAMHGHLEQRFWSEFWGPLSAWNDSLKRAFSRTRDFAVYEEGLNEQHLIDGGGGGAFPPAIARILVRWFSWVLLLAVCLAIDIIRVVWTLLRHR